MKFCFLFSLTLMVCFYAPEITNRLFNSSIELLFIIILKSDHDSIIYAELLL